MAVNWEIRNSIPWGTVILDNSAYDNSIIGMTIDGRLIYEINRMIEEYANDNQCTEEEAIEWIEYNTIRALPYMGSKAPVIVELCE